MYSMVMLVAMTTAPETIDCHRQRGGGCQGAYYGGCTGRAYGGCSGGVAPSGRAYYGGPYYAGSGYYYTTPGASSYYSNGTTTYPTVTSNYLDTNGFPNGPRVTGEAINAIGMAPARIEVNLPADAKLMIDSTSTVSHGNFREFVTPPLDANRDFTYKMTVTIMRDQKEKKVEKQVQVRGGRVTQVDFITELAEPVRAPNDANRRNDDGIQRIVPETTRR